MAVARNFSWAREFSAGRKQAYVDTQRTVLFLIVCAMGTSSRAPVTYNRNFKIEVVANEGNQSSNHAARAHVIHHLGTLPLNVTCSAFDPMTTTFVQEYKAKRIMRFNLQEMQGNNMKRVLYES